MPEVTHSHSVNAELHLEINRHILEDMNLEGIRQIEELTARIHAYEAICTHLYRERLPLSGRLPGQTGL